MTILVVGIGNPWASDDGVGGEAVRCLRDRLAMTPAAGRPAARLLALRQPDASLLDALGDCERLIVVDAVRSGAPPGTRHRVAWTPGCVEERGVARASSHGLGVRDLLELAAAMGRLPAHVELWGVEIASTQPGQGLTPEVARALPALVESLLAVMLTAGDEASPGETKPGC